MTPRIDWLRVAVWVPLLLAGVTVTCALGVLAFAALAWLLDVAQHALAAAFTWAGDHKAALVIALALMFGGIQAAAWRRL